jgi:hypothetical protein
MNVPWRGLPPRRRSKRSSGLPLPRCRMGE